MEVKDGLGGCLPPVPWPLASSAMVMAVDLNRLREENVRLRDELGRKELEPSERSVRNLRESTAEIRRLQGDIGDYAAQIRRLSTKVTEQANEIGRLNKLVDELRQAKVEQRDKEIERLTAIIANVRLAIEPLSDQQELLARRVDEIGWTARTRNMLRNENIETLGDLVKHKEWELLRPPNFGRKSLKEIKDTLAAMGLHLGMDVPA